MTVYDRAAEDVGNLVALEHVNLRQPDPGLATTFYVSGMGFTRDPYLMTGMDNMWINVGRSQFHLPTGPAQRLRGRIGVVVPDLDALLRRLDRVASALAGTRFSVSAAGAPPGPRHVDVTCPWGNRLRCHAPGRWLPTMNLGIAYVELDVPAGTAEGIARFYARAFGVRVPEVGASEGGSRAARIPVGAGQQLLYVETESPIPEYDGHHLQVYVADFSGPHRWLAEHGLVSEESDAHQYRFVSIVDPRDGRLLTQLEHEVRSLRHPLYARALVNRDPAQTNRDYAPGRDAWNPERANARD